MDKWLIISIMSVCLLILTGCSNIVCKTPYIQVGSACCLDQNANNICDQDELSQTLTVNDVLVIKDCLADEKCFYEGIGKCSVRKYSHCYLGTCNNAKILTDYGAEWCQIANWQSTTDGITINFNNTCLINPHLSQPQMESVGVSNPSQICDIIPKIQIAPQNYAKISGDINSAWLRLSSIEAEIKPLLQTYNKDPTLNNGFPLYYAVNRGLDECDNISASTKELELIAGNVLNDYNSGYSISLAQETYSLVSHFDVEELLKLINNSTVQQQSRCELLKVVKND